MQNGWMLTTCNCCCKMRCTRRTYPSLSGRNWSSSTVWLEGIGRRSSQISAPFCWYVLHRSQFAATTLNMTSGVLGRKSKSRWPGKPNACSPGSRSCICKPNKLKKRCCSFLTQVAAKVCRLQQAVGCHACCIKGCRSNIRRSLQPLMHTVLISAY